MTVIGEKISVLAAFRNGLVIPKELEWGGKSLKIDKIVLNYSKRIGSSLISFFSVNILGSASSYELSFNTNSMIWRLEKIEDDYAC